MADINKTLDERKSTYGHYPAQARISQDIKMVMRDTKTWEELSSDKQEALDMIAHKIARILNGNPDCADNWHDISGYSTLVERELLKGE